MLREQWMVAERCTSRTTGTLGQQHLRSMRRSPDPKHREQNLFGGMWPVLHTETMLPCTWVPAQVLRQQLAH